jgi:hypothetical protein
MLFASSEIARTGGERSAPLVAIGVPRKMAIVMVM